MMKTEKRRANVGERILITKATEAQGNYKNGDVSTVVEIGVFDESGTVRVKEHVRPIYASEYEVIVSEPKKSARISALETQVAALEAKVEALEQAGKYPLTAQFELQNAEVDAILEDIKRKAKPTLEALLATYPSQNQQRADVIKRAKAFVSKYTQSKVIRDRSLPMVKNAGPIKIELHVNSEKRVVTAVVKWANLNRVRDTFFAKCDPDDVFNADIGKAIALARALGVEVPQEFVKAVQPTEHVLGQRVYLTKALPNVRITTNKTRASEKLVRLGFVKELFPNSRILDDTDAVYE